MFCKVDHSLRVGKFIEVIEPTYNKFNKTAWINWWKTNNRVDLLAFA